MKPSTKLCKLLVLLCEAHNEKHPKKRKYTKRLTQPVVKAKRKYTKRIKVNPITAKEANPSTLAAIKQGMADSNAGRVTPFVIKRGPGRPRKVQPITATTRPNSINLTPEQQAKIDAIKKQIAHLSATLPSDRGE